MPTWSRRAPELRRRIQGQTDEQALEVAVLGATGLVGEMMLTVLEERKFPVQELFPLASDRSLGKTVQFQGRSCRSWTRPASISRACSIGLFSAGGEISADLRAQGGRGRLHRHRQHLAVSLRGRHPAGGARGQPARDRAVPATRGIIANPNCSTIQMVVALKPIYDAVGIERINVATYQSVSGAGRKAVEELADQTAQLLNGRPIRAAGSSPSRSPSTVCRRSTSSWTTATPRKR